MNRRNKVQYTKKALTAILVLAFFFVEQSYILALLDKEMTLEELSIKVVELVLGVFVGYCMKSFFETKEERKTEVDEYEEEIDEP